MVNAAEDVASDRADLLYETLELEVEWLGGVESTSPPQYDAATGVATADWLRPGSFEPPGEPDAEARARYDRHNPLTNLESYRHTPAINFQCGALDEQVPSDGAQRFVAALRQEIYANCPDRLEVILHEGVPHRFTDEAWDNCITWFRQHLPT